MAERIQRVQDLQVFERAMSCTMAIFELTKTFPADEKFSLVDQVRRSSRSVCANLAEGWRKRRYEAAFIAKLSDAEGEAGETIVWLEIARRCGYVSAQEAARLAEDTTTSSRNS